MVLAYEKEPRQLNPDSKNSVRVINKKKLSLTYAQFTQAIAFCRQDGMVRDHEAYLLYRIASMLPSDAVGVEIGSWKGKSAVSACWGLEAGNGHLHAVDNFAGVEHAPQWGVGAEIKEGFQRNMVKANVTARCTLHEMSAHAFSQRWSERIDYLFIDGCHYYNAARFDIFAFMKFVKPGGWAAFHDIRMKEDVIRALREYLDHNPTWTMEAVAWDNNLLALKRATDAKSARPLWQLKLVLFLAPLSCAGIPPSSKPLGKIATKLAQSMSRFVFRRISLRSVARR